MWIRNVTDRHHGSTWGRCRRGDVRTWEGGESSDAYHSDWYIGIRQETRPTPKPAKTRPTTKRGIAVAAVYGEGREK